MHQMTLLRYVSLNSFLSAAAHFNILRIWDQYEADLKKGMNRWRWYEYSL